MPVSRAQRAPRGLRKAGKALWAAVTDGLTLRADELATLEAACRTADTAADLQTVLDSAPGAMIEGSRGQLVLHPAIPELRQQRALLAQLLARLDLPEATGAADQQLPGEWDGLTASARATKAARARWKGAG